VKVVCAIEGQIKGLAGDVVHRFLSLCFAIRKRFTMASDTIELGKQAMPNRHATLAATDEWLEWLGIWRKPLLPWNLSMENTPFDAYARRITQYLYVEAKGIITVPYD